MKFKKSIATLALLGTIFTAGSAMAFPDQKSGNTSHNRLEQRHDIRRYAPRPAVKNSWRCGTFEKMSERTRHHDKWKSLRHRIFRHHVRGRR